ncbi:MAG TPA: glycosyltransferase family A protein [Limnochordales bacterium]
MSLLRAYERIYKKRPEPALELGCGDCTGVLAVRELGIDMIGAEGSPQFLAGPLRHNPFFIRLVGSRVPLATRSYPLVFSMGSAARFRCDKADELVAEHLRVGRDLVFIGYPQAPGYLGNPPLCRQPQERWRALVRRLGGEVVEESREGLLVIPPRSTQAPRPAGDGKPTVSVVIPCYKLADYLPETLESVLAQTRTDWEAVVVNDGSPDHTPDVVKAFQGKYGTERIRYVEQPNRGLAEARNAGIRLARGSLILPLDADDLIEPTYLQETVEVLERFAEFGIVYTHYQAFGIERWEGLCSPWDPCRLIQENLLPSAALFRKTVWESVGGYDPAMKEGYEDWELWVAAAEAGWWGACVPKKLYLYRRRPGSMITHSIRFDRQLKARIRSKHHRLLKRCQQGQP